MPEEVVRVDCRGAFRRAVAWGCFALVIGLSLVCAVGWFLAEEFAALNGRLVGLVGGSLLCGLGVAGVSWATARMPRWVEFGSSVRFGYLVGERVVEWGQVRSLELERDEVLVLPAGRASERLGLSFPLASHTVAIVVRGGGRRRVPIRTYQWERLQSLLASRGIQLRGKPAEPGGVLSRGDS